MTRPLAKAVAAATLLLGFTTIAPPIARGEFVIEMTGTVEEGDLNGVDLAGADFVYGGIVTNPVDIDDVFPGIGTFVVDTAFLDFGNRGFFEFGLDPSYFYWYVSDRDVFYAGIALSVDVSTTTYDDGFNIYDLETGLASFDPESLSSFGPFSQFDGGATYEGEVDGPFAANNDFGDSLVMDGISDVGTLTITAIPEPSSVLFGTAAVAALCICHRRRSGSVIGA